MTISISISISIFFKSVDISTIDMSYRYIEQGYLLKSMHWLPNSASLLNLDTLGCSSVDALGSWSRCTLLCASSRALTHRLIEWWAKKLGLVGRPPLCNWSSCLPLLLQLQPLLLLILSKLLLPQSVATVHVVQVMFLPPPTATGPCNLVFVPACYNNIGKAGHPSFLNMLRPWSFCSSKACSLLLQDIKVETWWCPHAARCNRPTWVTTQGSR